MGKSSKDRKASNLSMDNKEATPCCSDSKSDSRIKLNVGGKQFETTISTIESGGATSVLKSNSSSSSNSNNNNSKSEAIFIDRDPEILSSLLSLLRTHRLPSNTLHQFSLPQLVIESNFYGLQSRLFSYLSPPPLTPFDASLVTFLSPPSSHLISTFSVSSSSSYSPILLAHSGHISYYNPITFSLSSTLRTHLDHISSLSSISPQICALGSYCTSGLHFYTTTHHLASLHWVDHSDTRIHKSRVTAISDSAGDQATTLFSAAFESKHGENAVLIVDKSTLKVVSEIGRQSGNSAKSSAIKRLRWVPDLGFLVGSSVNYGAFGYSGYVRLWDPKSGDMVWETNEPGGIVRSTRLGDTMADIDVDPQALFMAKLCSKSGDLGVADFRKLGPDPWVYLGDPNPGFNAHWKPGGSVVVHCYKGNVFVARDGTLEAWSRVGDRPVVLEEGGGGGGGGGGERRWGMYRRNYVDQVEDSERGIIRKIEAGGNRLFVSRENVQGVEVWETSSSSGVKTVL